MKKRRRLADRMIMGMCAVFIAVSTFFYSPMGVSAAGVSSDFTGVAQDSDGVYKYFENGIVVRGKGMILYDGYYYYVRTQGNVANTSYQCLGTNNHLLPPRNYNFESDGRLIEFDASDRVGVKFDCNCGYGHYYLNGAPVALGIVYYSGHYYYTTPSVFSCGTVVTNTTKYISDEYTNGLIPAGMYEFNEYGAILNPPSDEPTYDEGYSDGYNAGFEAGENSVDTDVFYQQGYDAGLEFGESKGYESGYDAGYDEGRDSVDTDSYYQQGFEAGKDSIDIEVIYQEAFEAGQNSIDTNKIYQDAFEAGKDSVDTDSYYDEGYQKGFDAGVTEAFAQGYQQGLDEGYAKGYDDGYDQGYAIGYSDGYKDGYDVGYQDALDRISFWGADTSDYPVYITSSSSSFGYLSGYVYGNSQVYDEEIIALNFDINPNHIYRFDVKLGIPQHSSYSNVYGSYTSVYFCAGGVDYFISPALNFGEGSYESIYVRGDILSSSFSKKGVVNVVSSSVTNPDMASSFSFNNFWHDVKVYDVGPIGNMQNHIANQTDQLTGGFDNSKGNSVNSDLSTGLNDYQTAEDSLFATATSGMKDFTFFDFTSVPAMITGMSFITSIMGSWFTHAGGASGVGIVLSILFSVMLVAMVLGLYRWYQSRGGKK